MQKPNKKQMLCFGCTLACGFVALGGYWGYLHSTATPEIPVNLTKQQKTNVAPAPVAISQTLPATGKLTPPTPNEDSAPQPAAPLAVSPQNVGRLTALQGELEELKILVAIDELSKKLRATPPENTLPTLPLPALVPPAKAERSRPVSNTVAVIGVQGIDGKLKASVRTATGRVVTLHTGDHFAGGIVSNISRQGVTINSHGKHSTLNFE